LVALEALIPAITSCSGTTGSSTAPPASTPESSLPREEILAKRAGAVFSSIRGESGDFPGNLITGQELYSRLQDPAEAEKLFILDTRPRNEWDEQGHIEGANWMKMQAVADPGNLEKLPKDKLIVCVSPTGHTAVQVMTVLRWLGYDAIALKHGMAGWTPTAAGRLMINDVEGGIARKYPVAIEPPYSEPMRQEPLQPLTMPPAGEAAVLEDAAQKLLHDDVFEKEYPFNHIFADDLYLRTSSPARKDSIYILDIRPLEAWQRDGHIGQGDYMLIDWRVLGDPLNLAKLPKDRLIVVVGETGQTAGQVTPILRMLGYNAVTLRSGMTAWTETPDSQDTLHAIRSANYPVVK